MADNTLMNVVPTIVGGAVALKLLDYAMPDKTTRVRYVTKRSKPAKFERCSLDVEKSKGKYNTWVCTKSLKGKTYIKRLKKIV